MAPKGNKNALGNNGGRPRTVSPDDDELVRLGKEMVQWVKANNPMHLKQWYSLEKRMTYKQWESMTQLPVFLPYYEEAINLVSLQYLRKDSPIEPSLKQRWQIVYFRDLKHAEEAKAKADAELRKLEESKPTQIIVKVANDGLGSGINVQTEEIPAQLDKVA